MWINSLVDASEGGVLRDGVCVIWLEGRLQIGGGYIWGRLYLGGPADRAVELIELIELS